MSKVSATKKVTFTGPELKQALDICSSFIQSSGDSLTDSNGQPVKGYFEQVLEFATISYEKAFTNCTNSSMPPSQNPNRLKQSHKGTGKRKTGGQPGHPGSTMAMEEPDQKVECRLDKESLPQEHSYTYVGPEIRQVIEIQYTRRVIHLERTALYLRELFNISISEGTLINWRTGVSKRLAVFDVWVRRKLLCEPVIHCDETSCNINGKQMWLHTVCSPHYSFFFVSNKRGSVAMDEIGILPAYKGVVTHDCFSSYFLYLLCEHSICVAHILRELQGVIDREGYSWAKAMIKLLIDAIEAKDASFHAALEQGLAIDATTDFGNGAVSKEIYLHFQNRFRHTLGFAETACGLNHKNLLKGSQQLPAGNKTKNLVIRLKERETEVLLFLKRGLVVPTNNAAERSLRMSKVHEKVSGCCRSMKSAQDLARIRSYIYTCDNFGISCQKAIIALLEGKLPDFINLDEKLPELEIIQHKDESS